MQKDADMRYGDLRKRFRKLAQAADCGFYFSQAAMRSVASSISAFEPA